LRCRSNRHLQEPVDFRPSSKLNNLTIVGRRRSAVLQSSACGFAEDAMAAGERGVTG